MFGIHTQFYSLFQNKCKVNENVRSHLSFHSVGEPVGKPTILKFFFCCFSLLFNIQISSEGGLFILNISSSELHYFIPLR